MWMEKENGTWAVYDDDTGKTRISESPPPQIAFDEDEL